MSRLLRKPPIDPMVDAAIKGDIRALNELKGWFRGVWDFLGNVNALSWEIINKTGSKLSDLAQRPHAQLTDVQGWQSGADTAQVRHVSQADGKVWQDHVEITNGNPHGTEHNQLPGLDEDDHEQYLLLAGRPGQRAAAPLTIGSALNNTTFEEDGTAKFNGTATVWKDIFFPMAPPKATGAGNPTLTTWNGNLRGYSFAVNDTHDFDPQEFVHDGKEGSEATWHIHFISRTNVAADRAIKFRLEFSQANRNGVYPAPTTVEVELTIPANTPAPTHLAENLVSFTTGLIASQMYVKLTRIAAAGTAPADDPIITGVHYHYEVDTVGSRQIFTKGNP